MKSLAFLLLVSSAQFLWCDVSSDKPLLLRHPAISRTQIVFVFGNDLWSVGREGGDAARLTTGVGMEADPVFSPDGSKIAFTGEYDGNIDVFVMPAAGGTPKRLTYHPAADRALGWSPDGKKILFRSNRDSHSRYTQMYMAPAEGGEVAGREQGEDHDAEDVVTLRVLDVAQALRPAADGEQGDCRIGENGEVGAQTGNRKENRREERRPDLRARQVQ